MAPQIISAERQFTKLPILQNGFAPKTRNGVISVNTTLFDIVLFFVASLYNDNDDLKNKWNDSKLRTLVECYIKYGACVKFYMQRNNILSSIFKIQNMDVGKVLDCDCTMTHILKNFLHPVIYNGKILNSVFDCKCNDRFPFYRFSNITARHINVECVECKRSSVVSHDNISYNEVIFITNTNEKHIDWEKQKSLVLNGVVYVLCAIIERKQSKNIDQVDHYIGHLLRFTNWYTYDNNIKNLTLLKIRKHVELTPILCIYAIYGLVCGDQIAEDTENVISKNKIMEIDKISNVIHLKNFNQNRVDSVTTFVQNSCGPDSLFQSLACLFVDNKHFRNLCISKQKQTHAIFFNLLESFLENHTEKTHMIRNKLLFEQFPHKLTNGLVTIDCDSNVFTNVQKFVTPFFPSIKTTKTCPCSLVEIDCVCVDLDLEMLSKVGASHIEACIKSKIIEDHDSECACCEEIMKVAHIIGDLIFVDVQSLTLNNKSIGIRDPINICNIQKIIPIRDCLYELFAVIEYKPSLNALGHYIAHVLRNGSWHSFDDTKSESYKLSNRVMLPHMLIYYKK